MNYFLDTEFIEWAGGIDLVSIGIVAENGSTFYAESTNFDERNADQWVKDNVLSKLRWWGNEESNKGFCNSCTQVMGDIGFKNAEVFGTNKLIAEEVLKFIGEDSFPQFYTYYGAYDWVLFCRLFGRMIDLPEGFPMYSIDLKQMMVERSLNKEWKQRVCPDPEGEHNALVDATWNQSLFKAIWTNGLPKWED